LIPFYSFHDSRDSKWIRLPLSTSVASQSDQILDVDTVRKEEELASGPYLVATLSALSEWLVALSNMYDFSRGAEGTSITDRVMLVLAGFERGLSISNSPEMLQCVMVEDIMERDLRNVKTKWF